MPDCIFCKIAEGQIPSNIVHEDEEVLAFDDVNPVAPIHVLIIPKKHVSTLNDTAEKDAALLGKLLSRARDVAGKKKLSEAGYRIIMNVMSGAGQSVFHIHLHLLGGRPFSWPPG
jgi:histidine triad (HIT) family protein